MQNWLAVHMTQLISLVGLNTKPKETPIDIVENSSSKEGKRGTYVDTTIKLLNSIV
jgi:translation elongation factor P/translation initiation factor 5A